jgi:outer membrane protein
MARNRNLISGVHFHPVYIYMRSRSYLTFFFCGLLFAGGVSAQSAEPSPSPTPFSTDRKGQVPESIPGVPAIAPGFSSDDRRLPDLGRIGVDLTDQRILTLAETIRLAFENNTDIEVVRQAHRIAEFDLRAARGVYEPKLIGQTYYERSTLPNISFFTPDVTTTTSNSFVGNAGLQAPLSRYGTVLSANFNNQRFGTDNPITIISPQYNSSLSFSLVQPLFRGRSLDQPRRAIEISKRNLALTDIQFRQRSIEIVAAVERTYWDLVFALRNLQVQRDGVRDAKEQLEHNRRLVEEGQLAPIDIVAAETQVANYEQAVYDALNVVNQAENALKNLISPNRNTAVWREALVPVEPVDKSVPVIGLDDALAAALANRPEVEINRSQKDLNEIDQRYFRGQTKPQIDLIAGYTSAGVGGSLNPNFNNPLLRECLIDPTTPQCVQAAQAQQALLRNVGSGATAITDIFANKYPTFRVGIQFTLPLQGDKTSRALLGRARVEGERLETQREAIEQGIQVEVRNAIQSVRTAEARLRTAAIARENTARQYESEQRKLEAGQSDVYRVLERQTALTAARSNELRARTELNKAISELNRVMGQTLAANNVEPLLK